MYIYMYIYRYRYTCVHGENPLEPDFMFCLLYTYSASLSFVGRLYV